MRGAALALLLLGGCMSVPAGTGALSVRQALARADELNGQMVEVEGVIGGCNLSGCALRDADGTSLFAGGDAAFASAARRAVGRMVVVRGRVDSSCLRGSSPPPPGTGLVACVGRGTPLLGSRIVAVR